MKKKEAKHKFNLGQEWRNAAGKHVKLWSQQAERKNISRAVSEGRKERMTGRKEDGRRTSSHCSTPLGFLLSEDLWKALFQAWTEEGLDWGSNIPSRVFHLSESSKVSPLKELVEKSCCLLFFLSVFHSRPTFKHPLQSLLDVFPYSAGEE